MNKDELEKVNKEILIDTKDRIENLKRCLRNAKNKLKQEEREVYIYSKNIEILENGLNSIK